MQFAHPLHSSYQEQGSARYHHLYCCLDYHILLVLFINHANQSVNCFIAIFLQNIFQSNLLLKKSKIVFFRKNPLARSGLFTDLSIYPYGGTSADLSKIPQNLRGIVIYCPRKSDQSKKVGNLPIYENTFCKYFFCVFVRF